MMKLLEIITIGDEILRGSIVNTNANWLAKTLNKKGVHVKKIVTIEDSYSVISKEIKKVIEENTDILITTGGLGPTPDDKTLEGLGKALGEELTLNQEALQMVIDKYSELVEKNLIEDVGITPARKKMARLPKNSIPVFNPVGGAPGVLSEKGNTKILCLPGIPAEMKATLKKNLEVLSLPESFQEKPCKVLGIKGRGESSITPILKKVEERFPNAGISSYPSNKKDTKVKIRLTGEDKNNLKNIENFFKKLLKNLKEAEISKR